MNTWEIHDIFHQKIFEISMFPFFSPITCSPFPLFSQCDPLFKTSAFDEFDNTVKRSHHYNFMMKYSLENT